MANAILGFPRLTEYLTFSGGSWNASYPSSNMKALPVSRVARSTDALNASTQFVATLDRARPVRLMALVRHNLSLTSTMRIRLYADTGLATLLHDTGEFDVWPEAYPFEDDVNPLEWEDDNWFFGTYSTEEIAGYTWTRPVVLDEIEVARAIKVEIFDTSNASGAVEFGLFEVSSGYQLGINANYGAEYGFRFRTEATEALGGVKYFERKDKPRVFRGEVSAMGRSEAQARAFEAFRRLDIDTPVLWVPDPADESSWLRNAFLARLSDPGLMRYAYFAHDSVPISLEEVL